MNALHPSAGVEVLFTPGGVHELRIPNAGREGTISGYFDDPGKLAAAAARWDPAGFAGVYLTVNSVNPALLARCANDAKGHVRSGEGTADRDVASRRWLFVDIDAVRPAGVPSTNAEHAAAFATADRITAYLSGLGWPAPVRADSGNGAYLCYRIDLPNDDAATQLVKGCVEALSAQFSDAEVKVDTTAYNAARLMRIPGTTNRKGSGSADRPHRLAALVAVPDPVRVVDRELLEALAAQVDKPAPQQAGAPATAGVPTPAQFMAAAGGGGFDLEGFLGRHFPGATGPRSSNGREVWVLPVCPFNPEHDRGEAYVGRFANGALYAGCHHDSCQGWGWPELRARLDPPGQGATTGAEASPEAYRLRVEAEALTLRVRAEARRLVAAEERGAVELPEVLTLAERLARPAETQPWRIPAWLPAGGRVVLAAQFKAGKTTLVGNLLRCLVDGDPWLGTAQVEPMDGTVALFDFEMAPRQLDEWLGAQQIGHPDRVVVIPMRGAASSFDILDPDVRERWAKVLAEHGAAFVVWDCLRPVVDALGLDENHDAGRLLTAFDALLAAAGVPEALVVHHMGHAEERARGDSRIRDWPEVEWRIVREDAGAGSPRYIAAYGRDVDVAESKLEYDPQTRRLSLAGGSRAQAARGVVERDLRLLLASEAGLSGRAIEDRLHETTTHSRQQIRAALVGAVRAGSVVREPGPKNSYVHSLAPSSVLGCDCAWGAGSGRKLHSATCAIFATSTTGPQAVPPSSEGVTDGS